jgi:DNA modification methylase
MNLMQGDCLERMKEIESGSVDIVFTSPPYNRKRNDKYKNHTDIVEDYVGFLEKAINECLRVCSGNVFFNIQKNSYQRKDVHKIMGMFSDRIIEVIIWHKSNPMPNPHLINAYEYILVLSNTNKSLKANSTYTLNHFTTPVFSNNPYKKIHRAVMHPAACDFVLKNFGKAGDVVFDPFMGVGTTGVECAKFGMDFVGIELNEEYFSIAQTRIEEAIDANDLHEARGE